MDRSSDWGDIAGSTETRICRADAAPPDGRGPEEAGRRAWTSGPDAGGIGPEGIGEAGDDHETSGEPGAEPCPPGRSMTRRSASWTPGPDRPSEPSRRPRGGSPYQDRSGPPARWARVPSPDRASPAASAPRRTSLTRRSFLRRRLRPRKNTATLLRGARAAALALAALAGLALGVPEQAAAQTATTFVSNFNQLSDSHIFRSGDTAQPFTTGSNTAGYTLSSVDVKSENRRRFSLSVCATDSNSYPDTTSCTPLVAPGNFAIATLAFMAPTGTTLDPDTTYTLLFSRISSSNPGEWSATTSDNEDTASLAGWEIANVYHFVDTTTDVWRVTLTGKVIQIDVKGTAAGGTTNAAPTGTPTITGTAEVGQTLTAVTTGIIDANGLTTPGYTYQWIRANGSDANISGANSSTYTLRDADLGKTIKVQVTFTDDDGYTETLTSDATATVSAVANTLATGAPTISGTAQVGQTLTAVTTAIIDANGLTTPGYRYQWIRVDGSDANISGANSSTYTLRDADLDKTIKVQVTFTDDDGYTETLTSDATATVSAVANTLATGAPTISGTAQVGQTLTAVTTAIIDANGLTTPGYRYQWIRVDGSDANISGANSSTYTLRDADLGKTIKVQVTFTDDDGYSETLTSDATATVSAVANTLATGAPTITGTAEVGQTLTAVTTGIIDANGLTTPNYTYQWIRVDGSDANISGANSSTYTLRDADLDKTIKVQVTFTDDDGYTETLTSDATATVSAVANTLATGAPTITGTAEVGQTLTAVTTGIMDANGLTTPNYTYQWIRANGSDANISGANSSTYTLRDADLGKTIKVQVTFTDDDGYTETLTSDATATVSAVANTLATGAPTITGTAEVGQTLTAVTTGIMDANGLTTPNYTYQWIRANGSDANISGANSSTYTLRDADLGKTIKVRVTFVTFADAARNSETLTSEATATVVAAATAPTVSNVAVTSTPASGNTYLAGEAIEFTVAFSAPVTVTGTPTFAFRLGATTRQAAFTRGSDSAALVFARTVQAGEVDRDGISWNANALALGGGTITKMGATAAASLTHAAQAALAGHRVDAAPPALVSASVRGRALALVYDEALNPASRPAANAYMVTATAGTTTTNPAVSAVAVGGSRVTLTLDTAPSQGATVTLAYAPPASNPVQDAAGNDAPAFSDQSVTVGTPPPPPPPPPPTGGGGGGGRARPPSYPGTIRAEGGDGEVTLTWDAPSSQGSSRIEHYEYRIDGEGEWISTGSADRIHTITGLINGRVYFFHLRAVSAAGAGAHRISPEATPVADLDFTHFANGGFITSTLALVNAGAYPVRPAIYFYDQDGDPIAARRVVELTPDLEVGDDSALRPRTVMNPLSELTIASHGRGGQRAGSVTVRAPSSIGGVLRFDIPGHGVAGVADSPTIQDALVPVRRQAMGINTGVAIRNRGTSTLTVQCRLMQDGAVLEEADIRLAANGQDARFIDAIFPDADTSDFTGSVRCTAPEPGRFSAVAFELDAVDRIFTTLPVVPVPAVPGQEQAQEEEQDQEEEQGQEQDATRLDFTHFANGGKIVSSLALVNAGADPVRPAIYFHDQDGDAIPAESMVDITEDLEVGDDGALRPGAAINPLGELTISTHGRGGQIVGSVAVTADGPIGGVLRFDIPALGVAGVGDSPPVRDALVPVRRQTDGINTGVAVHNRGTTALLVRCRLMRAGAVIEETMIPLAANGQDSRFIDQVFPTADTSDFAGSVRCLTPEPGRFSAVAFELDGVDRIFTTLPVVPVVEVP